MSNNTLDKSNSIFHKLAKDSITLSVTQILLKLKGLILLPILTKAFGTVNYGIWDQVLVIVGLLSPLVICGLNSASTRFLPGKSRDEIREGFFASLFYIVVVCVSVSLFLFATSKTIASAFFEGSHNALFVTIAGVFMTSSIMRNFCRSYFCIFLQIKIFSALIIFEAVANTLAAVLVVSLGYSIYELILSFIALDVVITLIALGVILRQIGFTRPRFTYLKAYLAFGLPLVPAGWFMWVLNASDRFFISHYLGLSELGIYSVSYNLGYMLINFFFAPIWLTFPPTAARLYNTGQMDKLRQVCRYSLKYALLLMIPATVGFSLLAEPVLKILSTADFIKGAFLIPWVTVGYIFHMLGSYPATGIELAKKTAWITFIYSFAAAANLLLNSLLIPHYGLLGATVATTSSFFVQMLLCIGIGNRYLSFNWDIRFILKTVFAAAIMAIVVRIISVQTISQILIAVCAGATIYLTVLLLMRSFSQREMRLLLGLIRLEKLADWSLLRRLAASS